MYYLRYFYVVVLACFLQLGYGGRVSIHITEVPATNGEWRGRTAQVDPPEIPSMIPKQAQRRFAPDKVTVVRTAPPGYRYTWNLVMLIYPSIDCETIRDGVTSRFTYTMSDAEIATAKSAMTSAVAGILSGSNGEAHITLSIVEVGRTITSLAKAGTLYYWPDPTITDPEMNLYCKNGKADSVMVYWPSRNHSTGEKLYNDYWGLSYGEIKYYSSYVGYSTVANIVSPDVSGFYPGEVFIHEWLHPTGGFYEQHFNAIIPNLDASGDYRPCQSCSNYSRDPLNGYMEFYRDYMTGAVWDVSSNSFKGIRPEHWQSGTPTNSVIETSVLNWIEY